MTKTLLYQFPLSHFCEKAKWALDFKEISYEVKNLIPGLHLLTTRRLSKTTSVPILTHMNKVVTDSTDIIDYLDQIIPEKQLTPTGSLGKQARELEEYCDTEIGVHLRRFIYSHVLKDGNLARNLIFRDTPNWSKLPLFLFFPILRRFMKKGMNISTETGEKSRIRVEKALEKLDRILDHSPYLVGSHFSRADLTCAALFAPMVMPAEHPFSWPHIDVLPKELISFRNQWKNTKIYKHIEKLYSEMR